MFGARGARVLARGSAASAGLLRRLQYGEARWAGCQALVLNTGSSSIKYGVYDVIGPGDARLAMIGLIEGVGLPPGSGMHKHKVTGSREQKHQVDIANHSAGLERIFQLLPPETLESIKVVGHRVVNGGARFTAPAVIDDEVEGAIKEALPLAPLHNPANLSGIQAARAVWGQIPHVAVFDTSFHATMPPESYRYAVPKEWYEKHGIRRYGFHGTSYSYILERVASELKRPASSLNLIVCHIGSGASMACIREGKSIDTTMGFTPLDGLVMGTRSGDVDGGVFSHLCKTAGMSVSDVDAGLNKKSGLYGLSGFSDMRSLQESADSGNEDAALAERIYVERVRKYLGAYLLKLRNKVDAIVFTAGVGENSARFRALVCEGLEDFGIKVDPGKNLAVKGVAHIEDTFSKTKIMVVPTDEEGSIALQSIDLVGVLPEADIEAAPMLAGRFKKPKHDLMIFGESSHSSTIAEELGVGSLVFPAVTSYQGKCGYFRIFSSGPDDAHIRLMREQCAVEGTYEDMHGMTLQEAVHIGVKTGGYDEVLRRIIEKYQSYKKGKDFVLIGGNFITESGRQLCGQFSAALQVPALLVQNARPAGRGVDSPITHAVATFEDTEKAHIGVRQFCKDMENVLGAPVAGVIVSNVPNSLKEGLRSALVKDGLKPWALTPPSMSLDSHTAAEIADRLGATIICGAKAAERVEIHHCQTITAHVGDFLRLVAGKTRILVVLDAGRSDVLFSLMFAASSVGGPDIAAILLTGATEMDQQAMQVLAGTKAPFPVLLYPKTSFGALMDIAALQQTIGVQSVTKIASAIGSMEKHVDREMLDSIFVEEGEGPAVDSVVPPKLFEFNLFQGARALQKRIVLPEGNDPRVVVAAAELVKREVCKVTLLGDPAAVAGIAKAENADLSGVDVIDHQHSPLIDQLAASMVKIRKEIGRHPTLEGMRTKLKNENYFGTMLVSEGICDGMVLGATYQSSDSLLLPAARFLPRSLPSGTLSSVYFMLLPSGVKVLGDCAGNVSPDAEQLADIAASSVSTALQFGIEPRVALIANDRGGTSEKVDSDPWLDQAAELAGKLIKEQCGREVPLLSRSQLEVAVDPVAAQHAELSEAQLSQDPERRVAGRASVLVFPDLKSSLAAYQSILQASHCVVYGPVSQGLKRPVNSVFWGCTVEDIVNTAALTCVQAK